MISLIAGFEETFTAEGGNRNVYQKVLEMLDVKIKFNNTVDEIEKIANNKYIVHSKQNNQSEVEIFDIVIISNL